MVRPIFRFAISTMALASALALLGLRYHRLTTFREQN